MIVPYVKLNINKNYGQTFSNNKRSIITPNFTDSSNISFGYNIAFKNYSLPCPTCGKKMMNYKLFTKFEKQISAAKNTKEILDIISNYGKYLRGTEQKCLNLLKWKNQLSPNANLQELIIELAPTHLKSLKNEQLQNIESIKKISGTLPLKLKIKFNSINKQAEKIILNDDIKSPFKRKSWIDNIFELTEQISNKKLADQIYQKAMRFPNSENNINAFIIKYSRRDSLEIAKRFLINSIVSIDHIQPKSNAGDSNWMNYIPKCRGCNSSEGKTTFYRRVKDKPEIIKNTQIFMDRVIGLINAGKKVMEEFYDYPMIITNKLKDLSKNPKTKESLINLDISHLKSKEWINTNKNKHKKH